MRYMIGVIIIWCALTALMLQGCATGLPGSGDTKLRDYQVPINFTAEAGSYVTQ